MERKSSEFKKSDEPLTDELGSILPMLHRQIVGLNNSFIINICLW